MMFQKILPLLLCGTAVVAHPKQSSLLRNANDKQLAATPSRHLQVSELPTSLYNPGTNVKDHFLLDQDQAALEDLLDDGDIDAAYNVYRNGGYSQTIATLRVDTLTQVITKGTKLEVQTMDGTRIHGVAETLHLIGFVQIKFRYNHQFAIQCNVGGLPQAKYDLDSCLPESGTIMIAGQVEQSYTYNPLTDNTNGRTLAGFSTGSKIKFHDCANCPYGMYQIFNQYYGSFVYGDAFASAAARGGATEGLTRGSMDFSAYEDAGRAEILKKTSVYMNVWMYVIGEMEDALDDCENKCLTCNNEAVHAWDEAVAFYTGSQESGSGTDGHMLFALANKRCENFKTCGEDEDAVSGISRVNLEVMRHFRAGQNDLLLGHCDAARAQKEAIEGLMTVPLVQGTLRYAWINDYQSETAGDKENAEGAIFAATVLPMLHKCSESDASFVYESLKANSPRFPGYIGIKTRLERNYECMGITCQNVGGLYDDTNNEYLLNAKPCGGGGGGNRTAAIVGIVLGVLIAILVIVIIRMKSKRAQEGKDNSFVPEVVDASIDSEAVLSPKSGPPSALFESNPPPIVVDDEVAANDVSDRDLPQID